MNNKKLNKKLIYIIAIAVLIVVVALFLFMCGKDDKKPTNGDADDKIELNTDKDTNDEEGEEYSGDGLQVEESGDGVVIDYEEFFGDDDSTSNDNNKNDNKNNNKNDNNKNDNNKNDNNKNDNKNEGQNGAGNGEGTDNPGLDTEEGTGSNMKEEWGDIY